MSVTLLDIQAIGCMERDDLLERARESGVSEEEIETRPTNDSLRLLVLERAADVREHDEALQANIEYHRKRNLEAMNCDFSGEVRIDIYDGREIEVGRRTKAHEEGGEGAWFCWEFWPHWEGEAVTHEDHERDYYTTDAAYLLHHTTARSIEEQRIASRPGGKAHLSWKVMGAEVGGTPLTIEPTH